MRVTVSKFLFGYSFAEVEHFVLVGFDVGLERVNSADFVVHVELALIEESGDGALGSGFLSALDDEVGLVEGTGDEVGRLCPTVSSLHFLESCCGYN